MLNFWIDRESVVNIWGILLPWYGVLQLKSDLTFPAGINPSAIPAYDSICRVRHMYDNTAILPVLHNRIVHWDNLFQQCSQRIYFINSPSNIAFSSGDTSGEWPLRTLLKCCCWSLSVLHPKALYSVLPLTQAPLHRSCYASDLGLIFSHIGLGSTYWRASSSGKLQRHI